MRLSSRAVSFVVPLVVLIAFTMLIAPRLKQRADTFESLFPRILATELSYYVSQYLARPVNISSVLIDRKHNRLQFNGITVGRRPNELGPALAKVDRLVVHYDPRFLTLHLFDPLSSIGDIEVYHPDLFVVHNRSGQWNVLNIGKPRQPNARSNIPLTTNIRVSDAALTYLDLAPVHTPPYLFTARATAGRGTIVLQKNGPVRWKLEAMGAPPVPGLRTAFRHAQVDGYFDPMDNSANINVVTDHGDMAHILGAYVNVSFAKLTSGDAAGTLNFYHPPPTASGPLPWQYVINADFANLSGTVQWLQAPVRNASGHAALSGQTIQFRIDGADYGGAHLSGSGVLLDFHQPVVNGTFTAAGVTEGMVYPFLPANERGLIRIVAPSSGIVTLQGPLARPDITGRLNSPAVIVDNIPVSNATLGFSYLAGQLSLSRVLFAVGGGTADLTGNLVSTPQGPAYRLTGSLQDIDLARLPLPAAFTKFAAKGVLTGNVQLTGAGKSFNLFTRFAARNTQFALNGTPYFARSASGVLRAIAGPDGLTAASTNLKANGLLIVMKGERYAADGLSGVVNARMGGGALQSLPTQGSLS
ncbi:MAG: hypothetical protein M3Y56_05640, partial [Armatimonadota bacterium]|nr:hypothetical protein [Armatimonadota bacterium]